MKVKYIGSLPTGVIHNRATGIDHTFKKNVPIEVPDDFGEQIVASGLWKRSAEEKKKGGHS